MPVTAAVRANFYAHRVLSQLVLGTQLQSYLEDGIARHTKALTTGATPDTDPGAWFEAVTLTDGAGASTLTFGDLYGVDGDGWFISEDAGGTYITDVPFENTGAVTYYTGIAHALIPQEMGTNLSDGTPEYKHHELTVAHLQAPTVVAVAGAGLLFTLGNHRLHASDIFTGRTAVIWMVDPESNANSIAIETVVCSGATVTSAAQFGQSTPSTTAANYRVAILGPVVTRSASIASLAGYAYVGTVVGGATPRTYDATGQNLLNTLGEVSSVFDGLLSKGWITLPALSGVGTGTLTFTDGVGYSNGRLHALAADTLGTLGAGVTRFVSFDIASGALALYTSWDTANSGDRVPVGVLATDGGSLITRLVNIGQSVKEFNRSIELTLSSDSAHRTAFSSLPEVLAAMGSIQSGSTLTAPGFVVDVVGDVTVAATISDQTLLTAERVTFRGRGGRWDAPGSRFVWTFDDSLIKVTTATLDGWAFEDVAFVCDVTITGATDAIVQVTGTGTIRDLQFRRCFVDGAPSLSGGAGGSLPQVLFSSSSNAVNGLHFVGCEVYTVDTVVQVTAGGLIDFRVTGGELTVDASAAIGAALGAVVTTATSNCADWWLDGVKFALTEAPCIAAYSLSRLHFADCDVSITDADVLALDIGFHAGFVFAVSDLWIHDSRIKRNFSAGVASSPVVRIRAMNGSQPAGIFLHSNRIEGDTGGADTAVLIQAGTSDLDGVIVHSNLIVNCDNGIVTGALDAGVVRGAIVHSNAIQSRVKGVQFVGADDPIALGNYVEVEEASAQAFDLDVAALLVGNVAVLTDVTGVGVHIAAAAVQTMVLGTRISGSTGAPISVNGANKCLIVGNVATDTGSIVGVASGGANTVLAGNIFDGVEVEAVSCLSVGNYVEQALALLANNNSAVGNWAGSVGPNVTVILDRLLLVGNHARGVTPGDEGSHHVVVGNWISADASYIYDAKNSAVTGNVIESTDVTLGSNSEDVALVGNYLGDATITDNGTANVTASNSVT